MRLLLILSYALLAQDPATVNLKSDVVAKSTKAVNYRHRMGSTLIDFKGTAVMALAEGKAKVESKAGRIQIDFEIRNLDAPTKFGHEYLTYVLWAITPEGRPRNLGEIQLLGGRSKISVTTELQAFGLIVTAEPYFAVTMPSDVIVAENEVRKDTQGRFEIIDAKYELLQRGEYAKLANPIGLSIDPKVPLELYQARNAVLIAKGAQADRYAPDVMAKAESSLKQAEEYQVGKRGAKPTAMMARDAVQRAEDARAIAVKRSQGELLEAERAIKLEPEKAALRARLFAQFSQVLETHDSDRGLVVSLGDLLFDAGKASLRSDAREKLARFSGLILAHPGLKLESQGHTDASGIDSMNQRLSEQRAEAVRAFLESQGISSGNLTAHGFGKSVPIADNESAKGRQQNRRVEIIVSGELIGSKLIANPARSTP